ncbi:MAG: molybdopterin molybdotransferase MoeA [Sulfurospirillum sp.]|nr:molybdopterin molybdotransferase MoeA [Sulfurospirillum sp.]MBL0702429.1 molybdopterin molybdotransferase MoeA [Sulfurospirillum sp.]
MKKLKIINFDKAVERSQNLIKQDLQQEYVSLFNSLGRTLAQNITCRKNLPAFNNAAMDGFAFKHSDSEKVLKIVSTIHAGMSIKPCLGKDECYKIMTGAKVPNDADTVIAFENTLDYNKTQIRIEKSSKRRNALRLKGEEQKIGNLLFEKGIILNSSHIAMLASQGVNTILVYRKINIAIFSTGNELKEPWEVASDDEIYNANSSALLSLLHEHGFEANYCGVIPDNLEESIKYFKNMHHYDAIVTTGGISVGEADFIEEALKINGFKEFFHGINIKPGRPTMMGIMRDTLVSSMPGNPLAAYVNAFLFLIPALKNLQGIKRVKHEKVLVKNLEEFEVKAGRVNIVLGHLKEHKFKVFEQNRYDSGMITPIVKSNAILITTENQSKIEKNTDIEVILF